MWKNDVKQRDCCNLAAARKDWSAGKGIRNRYSILKCGHSGKGHIVFWSPWKYFRMKNNISRGLSGMWFLGNSFFPDTQLLDDYKCFFLQLWIYKSNWQFILCERFCLFSLSLGISWTYVCQNWEIFSNQVVVNNVLLISMDVEG